MNKRLVTLVLSATALGSLSFAAIAPAKARDSAPGQASQKAAAGEVLVGFEAGATSGDRARAAKRVSATDREAVVRGTGRGAVDLVELRRGASEARAIQALQRDPAVAYAEPNWVLRKLATSTDPFFTNGSLWGMYGDGNPTYAGPRNQYGSQAAEAWGRGETGSANVVVGVIDEGIMHTHRDLDANAWTNPVDNTVNGVNEDGNGDRTGSVKYTDDVHGWDFYNDDNTVYDGKPPTDYTTDEHGTHVTGTIGAEANNAVDATQDKVVGVNWNVNYVSGKFLGANGGYTDDAIRAIDYMTDLDKRGANVVATNNSWGGGGQSYALHDAIIRSAKQGILFMVAAGNSGRDNDRRADYPCNYNTTRVTAGRNLETAASYDAVICVAAINKSGGRPSWSNYGRTTVDLGAPGNAINSTVPPDSSGTSHWSFSGTSMATPHVTGTAALYAAKFPNATAAKIRSAILTSTVYTSSLNGRVVTNGRLNTSAALTKAP